MFAFIFILVPSIALAETPRNGSVVGRPAISIDEDDCRTVITKQFVAVGQFDDVVLAEAKARAICAEAAGDLTIAYAEAKVIEARAGNDSVMAVGASLAAAQGGSTSYESSPSGTTRIVTGAAATEEARAKGLVAWQMGMNPALYGIPGYDPRLDASVALTQQSFVGFNQSQLATEAWRGVAVQAAASQGATQAELERARAEAAAAKKQAATLRSERDVLLDELADGISEP